MLADDLQPNRLERAKFKIQDLLESDPRVRIALVAFAGTAHTIVPLTSDYRIITANLNGVNPGIMPYPGSDLEAGLKLADSLMQVTEAPGTILLMGDDFDQQSFELLQNTVNTTKSSVQILPMGTAAGAEVPMLRSNRPMRDKSGNPVVSAIDEEVLSRLNSVEGILLNQLTLDNSDVEKIARDLRAELEFRDKEDGLEEKWRDDGLLFILPFAFFVLLWFRKGWVIYSLATLLMLSSCSVDSDFGKLWMSPDYHAQLLMDREDFHEAATLFTDPLRKGVAHYKAGNYNAAVEAFKQDSTAVGRYNLGLAYVKTGNLSAANRAFEEALTIDNSLSQAARNRDKINLFMENSPVEVSDAQEVPQEEAAQNIQNTGPEDLSGGGQEATEEDMKKERKEETVTTDIRMGKELDEVPEDFKGGKQDNSQKILMRKVEDDPSGFLKRKFRYQLNKKGMKPGKTSKKW
jgi:Ca-activated chloride channel family protein